MSFQTSVDQEQNASFFSTPRPCILRLHFSILPKCSRSFHTTPVNQESLLNILIHNICQVEDLGALGAPVDGYGEDGEEEQGQDCEDVVETGVWHRTGFVSAKSALVRPVQSTVGAGGAGLAARRHAHLHSRHSIEFLDPDLDNFRKSLLISIMAFFNSDHRRTHQRAAEPVQDEDCGGDGG